MGEWSEQLMAQIRQRIVGEFEIIGQDMVMDIRNAISTPVVRDFSGFNVIQRSPPFSEPWLETGNLWAETYYSVWPTESPELMVFNKAIYARRLNDGHDNVAPRPFMDFARQRWERVVPDRVAKVI